MNLKWLIIDDTPISYFAKLKFLFSANRIEPERRLLLQVYAEGVVEIQPGVSEATHSATLGHVYQIIRTLKEFAKWCIKTPSWCNR